ncbi:hypothetical protein MINS_22930 [Mycolicibacterium insubricum]|jgi:hypothetical protein|uniref:hypothetical protein n=1 Tax=Mycolicibacterium insubricum TaxID=444597 RepID=UPI00138D6D0B|nr:hypothetical protein [Mycolicibacterium insubricum]BBZ65793.1 hypothetical protein MINS_12220 [Mycolicibacterium insubricum]BBZ66861.1 hypothetical protein MINS_22900 [Mycolicibacterium insubricum]BBZ66864.1 hypothetical protein MINS_22930 [Mycolicibacterium insubricum]
MAEHPYACLGVPDAEERARRNAEMLRGGEESGFYDESSRTSLWPDDFKDWEPAVGSAPPLAPGKRPF